MTVIEARDGVPLDDVSISNESSSGMSVFSTASRKCDHARFLSLATKQATLAAKAILASGGSEDAALETSKAAAQATLLQCHIGTAAFSSSRGGASSFLRRRKIKRQSEVVASIALVSAMNQIQTSSDCDLLSGREDMSIKNINLSVERHDYPPRSRPAQKAKQQKPAQAESRNDSLSFSSDSHASYLPSIETKSNEQEELAKATTPLRSEGKNSSRSNQAEESLQKSLDSKSSLQKSVKTKSSGKKKTPGPVARKSMTETTETNKSAATGSAESKSYEKKRPSNTSTEKKRPSHVPSEKQRPSSIPTEKKRPSNISTEKTSTPAGPKTFTPPATSPTMTVVHSTTSESDVDDSNGDAIYFFNRRGGVNVEGDERYKMVGPSSSEDSTVNSYMSDHSDPFCTFWRCGAPEAETETKKTVPETPKTPKTPKKSLPTSKIEQPRVVLTDSSVDSAELDEHNESEYDQGLTRSQRKFRAKLRVAAAKKREDREGPAEVMPGLTDSLETNCSSDSASSQKKNGWGKLMFGRKKDPKAAEQEIGASF